jgi:predicted TPR repeat methyltransferase
MGSPAWGEDLRADVRRGLAYALDERLAPHYERHLVRDCHYRTPSIIADTLRGLGAVRGRWLDAGAGSGLVGKAIAETGLPLELVAVDLSAPMLELIDCGTYVDRFVADCLVSLPFSDGAFDGAIAAGLLEHVVDAGRLLGNVARVIKPRGTLLFTFPPNETGRTEVFDEGLVSHDGDAIRRAVDASGMLVIREVDYPAYLNGSKGWLTHRLVVAG